MHSLVISQNSISYYKWGTGDHLIIAIHGFADSAKSYEKLFDASSNIYTVYAIDLPFHGNTSWNENEFSKTSIKNIISKICMYEKKEKFTLVGHSMGGRVCLALLPDVIEQLEALFLIASDGLINGSPLHLKFPRALKKNIHFIISQSKFFTQAVNKLYLLKLIPYSSFHFVDTHFANSYRKKRVLSVWLSSIHLCYSLRERKKIINQKSLPLYLLMGQKDKIIPVSHGIKFISDVENAKLIVFNGTHKLAGSQLIDQFSACVKQHYSQFKFN